MKSSILLPLLTLLSILHRTPAASPSPFSKESLPTKAGYLSVNSTTDSAIYYAFYEAQNPTSSLAKTPIIIWLQGGPGCSSMIGNFFELGPWRVNSNLTLEPNHGSWNRVFGLLFLDNPIGTGFSIASTSDEIPTTQRAVAEHLYTAIVAFIHLNPAFKDRPVYITGESYAGKYVPAIGYYILRKKSAKSNLNFQGVAIGNGLTDPITQVATHALNAYYLGLINARQKEQIEKAQDKAINLAQLEKWSEATEARHQILRLLQNMTGLATLYDYSKQYPYQDELVEKLLNKKEAKIALGVEETLRFEICTDLVGEALQEDVMKSVKHMVEYLVRNTKVLLYQGFFDLRDGVVSTEAWVRTLKWEEIDRFLAADREVWTVNDELAGYVQSWSNLSNVVVIGAGHLVPADKPLSAQVMIEDWVLGKGLFGYQGKEKRDKGLSSTFKGSV